MSDAIKFKCKACDKNISVRSEYAGKRGKCPGCKEPLRVPTPRSDRSSTGVPIRSGDSAAGPGGASTSYSLADLAEMEANAEVQLKELSSKPNSRPSKFRIKGGKDCPSCGVSCQRDAVLCVHCGYSFEGGNTLKTKKVKVKRERGSPKTSHAVEQSGVARLVYLFYGVPLTLIGLVLVPITILAGIAAATGAAGVDAGEALGGVMLMGPIGLGLLFSGASLILLGVKTRVDYGRRFIRVLCLGGGIPLSLIGGGLIVLPVLTVLMGESLSGRLIFNFSFGLLVMPAGVKLLINGVRGGA